MRNKHANATADQFHAAEIKATGERYCVYCQRRKPVDAFAYVRPRPCCKACEADRKARANAR
jgi:hypothetical protein